MITLNATQRNTKDNTENLRGEGVLPAVVYGKKTESTPISVQISDFKKVYKEAGESTVISLNDGKEDHEVLIHRVDIHPVSDEPVHVDFYALEKGQKVTVTIPVEFTGEAPAEKEGAVLVKVLHEIEVEAPATKLPHEIVVDVSSLEKIDDKITISDISFGDEVEPTADPEDVIVLATEAKEIEEPEEPEEVDFDSIEVEEKGKEESASDEAPKEEAPKEE